MTGQKVWTSLAHVSHWCFVVARTDPDSARHHGLSFLLVPMDQPGVEVRPIVQITGGGEFNEVFFDDARTDADLVVGDVGDGWRVAMALLGFERGVSTLAQQVGFERELDDVIALARRQGLDADPVRPPTPRGGVDRLAAHEVERDAQHVREAACRDPRRRSRSCSGARGTATSATSGSTCSAPDGLVIEGATVRLPYDLTLEQRLFLFSRADTIYGGSNEIQRNVLGERVLGLPRDHAEDEPAADRVGGPQ